MPRYQRRSSLTSWLVRPLGLPNSSVTTSCTLYLQCRFQVGNTELFAQGDWEHQLSVAKTAGIDAFALNMAFNDTTNDIALPMAFAAATNVGFKLFFSFDYAGNGAWPKDLVTSIIQRYASHEAYFHRGSQPFVSTFEGPGNMTDWPGIKKDTGCFFMPDWSSIGAKPAAAAGIAGKS